MIHRSIYTLKEADPHSFAIPRIDGPAKAALVEIQADEYGGGDPERMHATIFARTMEALGLDATYGAYLDVVPGVTLATVNLVSLFALHRRLRGAAMGHLALFELTSAVPNRRYGNGLRRLGFGTEVTHYYDEHVEADSVHDMIAAYDLVGAMMREDPGMGSEDPLRCPRARAHGSSVRQPPGRSLGGRSLLAARGGTRGGRLAVVRRHEAMRAVAEDAKPALVAPAECHGGSRAGDPAAVAVEHLFRAAHEHGTARIHADTDATRSPDDKAVSHAHDLDLVLLTDGDRILTCVTLSHDDEPVPAGLDAKREVPHPAMACSDDSTDVPA